VPAAELALVNRLPVESKLKKGQRIRIPAVERSSETDSGAAHGGEVVGQRIKFSDGGTLNVDSAWRKADVVWFTRGKVTQSSDRAVKSIDPIYAAPTKEVVKQSPPQTAESAKTAVTTWIYLVGGARVKVDQVNETSDGAWYSRNNLTVFLARERIERIARDEPDIPGEPGRLTDWTSGSAAIDRLIRTNGSRFAVDPYLVFLVIEQESHFRPRVVSPKGAQGLMQLMPGTARRFGVKRPFDPVENIRGGTQYLKQLLVMFGGRVDLALASYNAGEGRVIQYGHKVPPFRETQDYVRRISKRYGKTSPSRKHVVKSSTQAGSGE
jgi:soluble lytic murein transglycosylase-like protein